MSGPSVAVIDIGSNSIKCLVATRDAAGRLAPLAEKTLDARISAGISAAVPRLAPEGMQRGLAAIAELLAFAAPFSPARTVLVATSAVRDAQNGADFRAQVHAATCHPIRLLSGTEEANLIGHGLACDPALWDLRDFYVFDLGGGSLECLAFRGRRVEQALSLQLGCVRLTEKFSAGGPTPVSSSTLDAIAAHARATLGAAGFAFNLPASATAVATGGTVATIRAIFAERAGCTFADTDPRVPLASLRALLAELSSLDLAARKAIPGLPAARADVFPTALATLSAIADAGSFATFVHSSFNLRYGLADETLSALSQPN